jgi:hypothetical protein
VLARDAQIHLASCVVGLGKMGQEFTQGLAELLLASGGGGRVETSMDFGLGDWSMPEGMGFWDLQTDEQVNHDNELYVKDRKDAEIAQKGTIRVATADSAGFKSELLGGRDYMSLGFEAEIEGTPVAEPAISIEGLDASVPTRIRVPGTAAYVNVR